jgi:hypothetical protein
MISNNRLYPRLEQVVIALLTLLYWLSFDVDTAFFDVEVFGQDTRYILRDLVAGRPYSWNAQNHLLYHMLVDGGWWLWEPVFGGGRESVFAYLKLLTAACGLGFLLVMRMLFRDMGLDALRRAALLGLGGVGVSAWFHFSVFETHGLAMPAIGLYLVSVQRLRKPGPRPARDRLMFVSSLIFCGLCRVDLWRFAIVSFALLLLPALRDRRRSLAVDLTVVAVLAVVLPAVLSGLYFDDVGLARAPTVTFERLDRENLRQYLGTWENLTTSNLAKIGRGIGVYTYAMPISPDAGENPARSGVGYFREHVTTAVHRPFALAAMLAVSVVLLATGFVTCKSAYRGDAFSAMLVLQFGVGWLLYTWFNPWEPFLWGLEFHALSLAALADASRRRPEPRVTWAIAGLAVLVGIHNLVFFYSLLR